MDLYVLDSLLRRVAVIDVYESLIWTERYSSAGDFELQIARNQTALTTLITGARLAINESDRVMTIESVESVDDSEGRTLLNIKGPSLEDVFDDRVAKGLAADTVDDKGVVTSSYTGKWRLTDTPGNIARRVVKAICQDGILSVNDKIPFLIDGTLYPADTIPENTVSITKDLEIKTVYEIIKDICDSYGYGFRLTRNGDNSQLFFNVYTGNDRTTQQTTRNVVIFSPSMDNVQDVKYLKAITNYKNTAYVYHKNGFRVVFAAGLDNVDGFSRRVLPVVVDDIDLAAGTELNNRLDVRGREELAKQKTLSGVDGEIGQNVKYQYKTDYNLGDLVELRDSAGVTNNMKVTEHIYVCDGEGTRSYPTLTTDLFINPGSWLSSLGAKVWNDATGTWSSLA